MATQIKIGERRHPLDGYDYVVDVPRGTSLLVQSHDGRVWRLARKGIRYHEDAGTLIHGAAPAKAPPPVAASSRIRALLEGALGAGELPADIGPALATWLDAPFSAGSTAKTDDLTVYADGWVRAYRPVYDDAPRTGARQLSARERATLAKDLMLAPRGVRLPSVMVTERRVEVRPETHDAATVARAATIEGATATRSHRVYPTEPGYAEALMAPGARLLFADGPVEVPEPATGWRVPVTRWREAMRVDADAAVRS